MVRIELHDASKLYGDVVGLHPINLAIEAGELLAIVGPSGSGKTTLVRLIAGLEKPTEGEVRFGGQVVNNVDPADRGVGLVVSQGALYEHMTSEGNVRFPLTMQGVGEPERTERVDDTAKRFGVRRLLPRRPRTLSAGERQLVATGRAAVRTANVLLFDEALAGIDPHLRTRVRAEIGKLHDGTNTIVYATNEQEEAMALADRLVVLDQGRLQQVGLPLDVYRTPANAFVAGFLGSPGMNVMPAEVLNGGRLAFGEQNIAVPHNPGPGPVLVGIRPEHARLSRPGDPFDHCFQARVIAVEELGSERVAHVAFGAPDAGAVDFAVKVSGDRPLVVGDRVELSVDPGDVVFFDRTSGARLNLR